MKHFFALLITFTFIVPSISASSHGGETAASSDSSCSSFGSYGIARREARRAERVTRRTARRDSRGSHGSYSVGAITINRSKLKSYDYISSPTATCPDCEGQKADTEDTSAEVPAKSVSSFSKESSVSVQRFGVPYLTFMKEKKVVFNARRP